MKFKILSLLFFLATIGFKGFAQQLSFTYDAAGNQTQRQWICINCRPGTSQSNTEPLVMEIKNHDSDKQQLKMTKIIASPNPFKEVLNLSWQSNEKIYVKEISIYTVTGVKTHDLKPTPAQQELAVPFSHMPVGTYIVYIVLSNQKRETFKVIKN
ncbi:T9SS type A sorting domain-containing protein [Pedobacter sp.]|uniref:T9SS type A sorting domain-containing protein n=1 Tax=Pedobacter sp. TaxID=1411316 RepID=UPI00396CF355